MWTVTYKSVVPSMKKDEEPNIYIERKNFEDRPTAINYICMVYGLELDRLANYSPDTNWSRLQSFLDNIDVEPIKLINEWYDDPPEEREVVTIDLTYGVD